MPIVKFILTHKKSVIAVAALSALVAEVVVRPARYVGFKNYPSVCKEFNAINKIDGLTVEQKKDLKSATLAYYHNQ